ncbi:MAG: hypothetical protein IT508_06995 [Burkholderiaceae bacterium]|nr:hypothetical protein [Burkholderiaceae bacterium]
MAAFFTAGFFAAAFFAAFLAVAMRISFAQDVAMMETRAGTPAGAIRYELFIGARTRCKRVAVPTLMNSAQKKRRARRRGVIARSSQNRERLPAGIACRFVVADRSLPAAANNLNSDPVSRHRAA